MIFDASAPCDLDALHAQALEVVLRRAGLRTLSPDPGGRAHAGWDARCGRSTPGRSC